MQTRWSAALLFKLLAILALVSLLGIAPRPHAFDRELQRAQFSAEAESYQDASEHLSLAAIHYPWRGDLWEQAGMFAQKGSNPADAIRLLERARLAGGLSPQGYLSLGDAYLDAENISAAVRAWQEAPASSPAFRRIAEVHRSSGDYPALIDALKNLLRLDPANARLNYELGLLYAATQPDAAPAYLDRAADLEASFSSQAKTLQQAITSARLMEEPAYTFMATGRALASMEEWELAVEAFSRAVRARPDYAEAWAFLGEARQRQASTGQNGGAETVAAQSLSDLWTALELDPQSIAANIFMAMYWQRQGKNEEAIDFLLSAAEADPDNPVLLVELGRAAAGASDLTAARTYYERAVDLAPKDPVYLRILAEFSLHHQVQIREIALPAARQAVILAPNDPLSLDLLGHTFYFLEDLASAERFFMRAIAADPDHAPAYLHLGMNYLVQGDADNALRQFMLAHSIAPDSPAGDQAQDLLLRYFP